MQQIEIKIQSENGNHAQSKFTPFGGAVLVGEVFRKLGIDKAIDKYIGARPPSVGLTYTDSSYVRSLVLMQILGGRTIDDLANIRGYSVIGEVIGKIPGRTSFHNYLASFADKLELSYSPAVPDRSGREGEWRLSTEKRRIHLW